MKTPARRSAQHGQGGFVSALIAAISGRLDDFFAVVIISSLAHSGRHKMNGEREVPDDWTICTHMDLAQKKCMPIDFGVRQRADRGIRSLSLSPGVFTK